MDESRFVSERMDLLRPPTCTFLPLVPAALSAANLLFAWSMISGAEGVCLTGLGLPILLGVLLAGLALVLLPIMWWGGRLDGRARVAAWTAVVALLLLPAGILVVSFF